MAGKNAPGQRVPARAVVFGLNQNVGHFSSRQPSLEPSPRTTNISHQGISNNSPPTKSPNLPRKARPEGRRTVTLLGSFLGYFGVIKKREKRKKVPVRPAARVVPIPHRRGACLQHAPVFQYPSLEGPESEPSAANASESVGAEKQILTNRSQTVTMQVEVGKARPQGAGGGVPGGIASFSPAIFAAGRFHFALRRSAAAHQGRTLLHPRRPIPLCKSSTCVDIWYVSCRPWFC